MSKERYGINDEQWEAITAPSPTMCFASAGSGKTKSLVAKIRYLLDSGVNPQHICAITFTNKAANEMKERLKKFCPNIQGIQISTIHSMCVRILKSYARFTPLKVPFSIYDDDDQYSVMKAVAKSRDMKDGIWDLISMISAYKSGKRDKLEGEYEEVYQAYQDILIKNNACDFDDLLIYAEMCLQHEECRTKFQGLWRHLLVDECHGYNTHVMIDYDRSIPIGDLYRDESITHVLSYDLVHKKIEKKRILRRVEKIYDGEKCDLWIKNSQGNKVYLKPTRNHKYYVVEKGYTRADELQPGDVLIEYTGQFESQHVTWCKYPDCKEKGYSPIGKPFYLTDHYRKTHGHKVRTTTCPICKKETKNLGGHNFWNHGIIEEQNKTKAKRDKSHKEYFQTEIGLAERKRLSQRLTENNPTKSAACRDKMSISRRRFFYSMPLEDQKKQIERFQKAPLHTKSPNKVEKGVIDLQINNLKFTGDGKYYVRLKDLKGSSFTKNPDFIYTPEKCGTCISFPLCSKNNMNIMSTTDKCCSWTVSPTFRTSKVVEIMDFVYWHSKEEAEEIIRAYDDVGIKCLVLDAILPLSEKRAKIESFINNHYATVISSTVCIKRDFRNNKVYTLGIEDNHNYFVVASDRKSYFKDSVPTTPILVSNCQDTSRVQYDIITKLFNQHLTKTMFLVGDKNQSVYGFRSARPENMQDFIDKYRPSVLNLTYNYRSASEIIAHANSFLQFGKPMVAKGSSKGSVSLTKFRSREDEAEQIASAIEQMGGYDSTAILFRVNARTLQFEQAFARKSIPYRIVGALPFYKRRISKDMLSYLKSAVNRSDLESLVRIVNTPKRGFGETKQEKLMLEGYSYLQTVAEDMPAIRALDELLNEVSMMRPLEAVNEIVFRTGYRSLLKEESDITMLDAFLDVASGFETVTELVMASMAIDRESKHGVQLMTAHASKGLEFDKVFVVGVEEGVWPHSLSEDVLEEERLYFVACSRARSYLNISYSASHMHRGKMTPSFPSSLFNKSTKVCASK